MSHYKSSWHSLHLKGVVQTCNNTEKCVQLLLFSKSFLTCFCNLINQMLQFSCHRHCQQTLDNGITFWVPKVQSQHCESLISKSRTFKQVDAAKENYHLSCDAKIIGSQEIIQIRENSPGQRIGSVCFQTPSKK